MAAADDDGPPDSVSPGGATEDPFPALWDWESLSTLWPFLFDEAPDTLLVVEADGQIVLANAQTEEMFGYDREELLGEPVERLVPNELREEHVGHRQSYMENPQRRPMGMALDLQAVRKDGTEFPVEISLSPLPTEQGLLVMAAVRDMTDRREIDRALRRYAERLEQSNEEWAQFAHVVSHDLQEPIRMIHSYAQLLEERYADELDADAQEFLTYMVEGATRMRQLIQDLLTYSRVDTDAAEREHVDAGRVLDSVLASLQVLIEERDAQIRYEDLPTVYADPGQLGQVFQNLITNAIKFTPNEEQPQIDITAQRDAGYWRFDISDEGIGIDPEMQDKIFQIFQRLHHRDEYEGQGLGLALCKKIVDRHGGTMRIESNPGEGTTISFTLPIGEGRQPARMLPEALERPTP